MLLGVLHQCIGTQPGQPFHLSFRAPFAWDSSRQFIQRGQQIDVLRETDLRITRFNGSLPVRQHLLRGQVPCLECDVQMLVDFSSGHQPLDECGFAFGSLVGWRIQVQHEATPDEGRRQLPLLVGRDDDQRQTAALGAHTEVIEVRYRKATVAQHVEQRIGHVGVGLVDLVDQQDHVGSAVFHLFDRLPQESLPDVLLVGTIQCAFDLRIRQAFDGIEPVQQIQSLETGMDHLDQKGGICHGRSRCAGDLALAAAGFAAHQQRPPGGMGQNQRVDLLLAPQMASPRKAAVLRQPRLRFRFECNERIGKAHDSGRLGRPRNGARTL